MKICDRCFEEYSDEEFVKMYQFPDSFICIPCNYLYRDLYKDFLIKFINNQPEHSKREDSIPEWGARAPLNYDEWQKRFGALNTTEHKEIDN